MSGIDLWTLEYRNARRVWFQPRSYVQALGMDWEKGKLNIHIVGSYPKPINMMIGVNP
jgi:hypothetical protein